MAFNIATYLNRIGLARVPTTVDGLVALQQAQMRAIPFENIDVLLGDIPNLTENSIWAKLINARRGGYCFELNKLFGLALGALGFTIQPILCRVRMGAAEGGPRTHQAFILTIEGVDWLADAGFGGPAPIAPLRLDIDELQTAGRDVFRLRADSASGELVVERKNGNEWFALYGFDRATALPSDFEGANFICARWDRSPFPSSLMMSVLTADGPANLFNKDFSLIRNQIEETETLKTKSDLQRVLSEVFRLHLPRSTIDTLWEKLESRGRV
ncbi:MULTISPECIES: arylamine N-acetyltransferase [Mesorhizobium]|uniref:arylamine N-acetyltransferase family protein n=1 Tax=Mesorhizobium TaxID=68287 RepID=UPI0007FBFCFB|nr:MULTISPECIES: arylamine N-acetyltransferase [Mesorhizobium]MUT27357.1 arylamine N-acetyltransferase [Mesorhizobium japonicum]OBQ82355.1 N-hydroxyarylamine O-acetyltransferase [Mesorhizobium sp. WSM3873]